MYSLSIYILDLRVSGPLAEAAPIPAHIYQTLGCGRLKFRPKEDPV